MITIIILSCMHGCNETLLSQSRDEWPMLRAQTKLYVSQCIRAAQKCCEAYGIQCMCIYIVLRTVLYISITYWELLSLEQKSSSTPDL